MAESTHFLPIHDYKSVPVNVTEGTIALAHLYEVLGSIPSTEKQANKKIGYGVGKEILRGECLFWQAWFYFCISEEQYGEVRFLKLQFP